MSTWLTAAITATLISSLVLFISYLYVYITEPRRYLKYFLIGWMFYIFRFAISLLRLADLQWSYLHDLILICTSANSVFLFLAVRILLEKDTKRFNMAYPVLLAVILISVLPFRDLLFLRELIVFSFSGTMFIYTGMSFFSKSYRQTGLSRIIGGIFILWGLHKFDYPLLHNHAVFAPIGYFLGVFCAFTTALGILMYYSHADRYELERAKDRLGSLRKIPQDVSIDELFNNVLRIAARITESAFAYLYLYDKDILNVSAYTFSADGSGDCGILEPLLEDSIDYSGPGVIENNCSAEGNGEPGLPKGRVSLVRFCAVPLTHRGKVQAVLGTANKKTYYDERDVSQLEPLLHDAWLLLENKQYKDDLVKARNAAQESEQIKSDFLANISHELRTPLNGVIGMLGLLDVSGLDEEDREYLELALLSAEDLHTKIKDILTLSEVTSSRDLVPESISIDDLIHGIVQKYASSTEAQGKKVYVEFENESGVTHIVTDHLYFVQICANIISNAFKFSNSGRVSIRIKKKEKLVIEISDDGCGISEDQITRIFEPFLQVENPYTKIHSGMGIGLTIALQLSKILGFELNVDSQEGSGSTFRVEMPLSVIAEPAAASKERGTEKTVSRKGEGMVRALIVEDEAINRLYLSRLLSEYDVTLDEARDGAEAIEKLNSFVFDIVFLDIGLPKVNGIEVLQFLRKSSKTRHIPVIAVTAHSHIDDQKRIMDAGADTVILKPYDKEHIISVMNDYILSGKSSPA